MAPSVRAAAVWVSGPRNKARAVRTAQLAAPAPSRSRARSQAAVDPTCWSWSAPAAPRASTPASSLSHWPSRRSSNRRSTRTRSARTTSLSSSRSLAASRSAAAASKARSSGGPTGGAVEYPFESIGATYQPPSQPQPPTQEMWTTFSDARHPTAMERTGAGGCWNSKGPNSTQIGVDGPGPTHRASSRHGARWLRATVPGNCMGPEPPRPQYPVIDRPRTRPTAPGPRTGSRRPRPTGPGHRGRAWHARRGGRADCGRAWVG
jgi:hypothetical protein